MKRLTSTAAAGGELRVEPALAESCCSDSSSGSGSGGSGVRGGGSGRIIVISSRVRVV